MKLFSKTFTFLKVQIRSQLATRFASCDNLILPEMYYVNNLTMYTLSDTLLNQSKFRRTL